MPKKIGGFYFHAVCRWAAGLQMNLHPVNARNSLPAIVNVRLQWRGVVQLSVWTYPSRTFLPPGQFPSQPRTFLPAVKATT